MKNLLFVAVHGLLAISSMSGQTSTIQYTAAAPATVAPTGQISVTVRVTNTGTGAWTPLSTFECPSLNFMNDARCVDYPQQFGAYGLQFLAHPISNSQPDLSRFWLGHADLGVELQPGQTVDVSRTLFLENLPVGDYVLLAYTVRNFAYAFGPTGILSSPNDTFSGSALFYFRVASDSTPPSIHYSGLLAGDCSIWPPNHQMVDLGKIGATDAESGLATLNVSITSSDPSVDSSDYLATANSDGSWSVSVRAERSAPEFDRVYRIAIQATDRAGNAVATSKSCIVPRDQGN